MFMCREATMIDPLGASVGDVFDIGSLKEKIALREDISQLGKSRSYNGLDLNGANDPRTVTVFLTPPSSPNRGSAIIESNKVKDEYRDHTLLVSVNDNEDDDSFRPHTTKDLRSMLIRDCMWNGFNLASESSNRTDCFEKFRSLTKTPPLVDCNLRITFVDPCEIWPFNLADQIKAGNRSSEEEAKSNSVDCGDEDIEIDVVGLEGAQKVKEKKKEEELQSRDAESCIISDKCENSSSSSSEEKTFSPLTPSTSDDEYTCKLRPYIKRKRTESESDRESFMDHKQRVSSGDESDQDCELGRATHNVLERKRRNELKQRFQYLRDSIPELSGNDRAPKVAILQKAFSYISYLKVEEKNLVEEARTQRNLNAQLLKKLLNLQQKY